MNPDNLLRGVRLHIKQKRPLSQTLDYRAGNQ